MICPNCDMHHDGPGKYCHECLMDFTRTLESGEPEVVTAVTEWLNVTLTGRDCRPVSVECPKCMTEFHI